MGKTYLKEEEEDEDEEEILESISSKASGSMGFPMKRKMVRKATLKTKFSNQLS